MRERERERKREREKACPRIYIYIYIYIHTYVRTYIHTYIRMLRLGSSSCSSSGYCSVAEVVTTVLLNNIYIIYISHKSSSHL